MFHLDHTTQYQDRFYSIGGGSLFVRMEGFHELAEFAEPEPVIVVVEAGPRIQILVPVTALPEAIRVPWWRRLWIILNMDVRDLWRMWRRR